MVLIVGELFLQLAHLMIKAAREQPYSLARSDSRREEIGSNCSLYVVCICLHNPMTFVLQEHCSHGLLSPLQVMFFFSNHILSFGSPYGPHLGAGGEM